MYSAHTMGDAVTLSFEMPTYGLGLSSRSERGTPDRTFSGIKQKKKEKKKTAVHYNVYLKDQYNSKKLNIHTKSRLKQYLFSANPELVCTVSPAWVLTVI